MKDSHLDSQLSSGGNILYATPVLLPSFAASSIQIMRSAGAFSKCGVQITVLAKKPEGITDTNWKELLADQYSVTEDVSFRSFLGGSNRWTNSVRYLFALVCAIKRVNPQLVYTRWMLLAFVSRVMGRPVVLELHDMPSSGFTSKFVSLLAQSKRFFVSSPSRSLLRFYRRYWELSNERLIWLPHGTDSVTDTSSLPTFEGTPTCGYVGSMGQGKGFAQVIKIAEASPQINFVVALSGDERQITRTLEAIPRSVKSHFRVFINLRQAELKQVYEASDLLLLPVEKYTYKHSGKASRQMAPLRAAEYVSVGLPVIASGIWPNREYFGKNGSAIYCSVNDTASWVKAVENIFFDCELAKELRSRAKSLSEEYHWRGRVSRVLDAVYFYSQSPSDE